MVKPAGKQKFRCHACGCYGTLVSDYGYSEERKSEILRAYHERSSLRGLECIFGVVRQTVAAWLKNTIICGPWKPLWYRPTRRRSGAGRAVSFVQCKASACWVWVALCRRTRQRSCPGSRATERGQLLPALGGIAEAYRAASH